MADKHHVVAPGDCVLSIAAREGIPWKKIWDYPANDGLRRKRGHPNILLPGDVLVIPNPQLKQHDVATDARHRFTLKGTKVEIRVRVLDIDGPRKNEPYHVEIDGRRYDGKTKQTDEEGLAVCPVPSTCKRAVLVVGKTEDEYELLIGYLDPADTVTGLHARLDNLGYDTGGVDTEWDANSASAMREFLADAAEAGGDNAIDAEDANNRGALVKIYSV